MTKLEMMYEILQPKTESQKRNAEDMAKKRSKQDIESIYNQIKSKQKGI